MPNEQKIEGWESQFDERAKKLYVYGGLSVLLDHPPHDMVFDEQQLKSFIRTVVAQARKEFATNLINEVNLFSGGELNHKKEDLIKFIKLFSKQEGIDLNEGKE